MPGAAQAMQRSRHAPHAKHAALPLLLPPGERFAGSSDPATRAAAAAIRAAEAEELAEQRRAKKAAFDAEYDAGAGMGLRVCVFWGQGLLCVYGRRGESVVGKLPYHCVEPCKHTWPGGWGARMLCQKRSTVELGAPACVLCCC